MATPAILGLGNPLLDISVTIPDLALATKYALKMGDACLASPTQAPLYDELAADPAALYIAGGATQHSIRVAQWVSGAPPGYAAFVGSVGDDAFGAKLRAAAAADGVAVLYQTQPAGGPPTGTCAVLVHEKERSLCANLAAAEALTAAHLEAPAVAAAVAAARIYYAAGFPLTHDGGAASALKLGELAAENGKKFAVNLSAPFICQVRRGCAQ
jgi:adenosine kinase